MFEMMDRMMMDGVGAMSMTRERAEKIFDEYVSRGRIEKDRREGFVNDLLASADKTRRDLEGVVARQVHETIVRLDIPTREDIQRLEQKLDEVHEKLDQVQGRTAETGRSGSTSKGGGA
ncbi:MAG: phasin family protein [Planctomycetota bacterium]